jgi:hypothetical protein
MLAGAQPGAHAGAAGGRRRHRRRHTSAPNRESLVPLAPKPVLEPAPAHILAI